MLEWVKASYSDSQVQDRAIMTTLTYVGANGRYNVYQVDGLNCHVVVFDNQKKLLDYINSNIHSIFLIRLLEEDNNKYMYKTEINEKELDVYTVARAVVIIPGTEESPRIVHSNGIWITVE